MNSRWLYKLVHDKMPPRKARRSPRRGPARSWKYKGWIRTLPCAACGTEERNVEAAHTASDGAMAQKASDYSCVPLCSDCHTLSATSYHRLGREEFERRHGLAIRELVARLNHDWFAYARRVK